MTGYLGASAVKVSEHGSIRPALSAPILAQIAGWVQSFVATPLIWDDEEVCDDDVTDLVYFSAEGRTMGALEARSEHFVDLSGTGLA
ncbi:hypothetical protein NKH73_31480 [Mesorhizobium sp. M0938]|uniref:hypothetical protein n=1 Tax=unclassified Mesorhizobium TaxID=325217 RepID=UPI0033350394